MTSLDASRILKTPAGPVDAADRVAVVVGACVPVPAVTGWAEAMVSRAPLPAETAPSSRRVTTPKVMPVAATVGDDGDTVEAGSAYPITVKSPGFHVSAAEQVTEKAVPLTVSSPEVKAYRQPVPAVRDRVTMHAPITDPLDPEGIAVVGAASPPASSRTNSVTLRGPVPLPKVPPPPLTEPASDHPDGVLGMESLGCPETT
ncbi:hypothetical protein ACWCQW_10130 [Streptomyces mirabilis]